MRDPAIARVQELVRSYVAECPHQEAFEVLDAGAGYGSPVLLPDPARLTALDVCREALDANGRADVRIVGDVAEVDLPRGHFDLVICWDTLEHLPNPYDALERLLRATKPSGRIILAFPNPWSPKGLVTKLTPLWFHLWVYRYVIGSRIAGEPGRGPFPVYLRWGLAPERLAKFFAKRDAVVEYYDYYTTRHVLDVVNRAPWTRFAWTGSVTLVKLIGGSQAHAESSDIIMVLRKRDIAGRRSIPAT